MHFHRIYDNMLRSILYFLNKSEESMPVQTPDMTAQVAYRIYQNRENNIRHHYYEE